jgi:hypothetical protein
MQRLRCASAGDTTPSKPARSRFLPLAPSGAGQRERAVGDFAAGCRSREAFGRPPRRTRPWQRQVRRSRLASRATSPSIS